MQVKRLSAQLGLRSELVDWYRDATSIPYGHFLIELSRRTDNRLRHCTNTGSIPSKFSGPAEAVRSFGRWHKKSLYSPSVPIIFPQMQKFFPSVFPKRVHQVPLRMYSKSAQKKPSKHKKIHLATKLQNDVRLGSLKRITWKQKRDVLASERGLQLIKVITPPVIKQLSWHGAVCSRSCFCIQHEIEYLVSYRPGISKVSTFTKSHIPNWFN